MADPVIPGGIRTQFILQGASGLPEDRFVTTWAFRQEGNLAPSLGDLQSANDLVAQFFTGISAPSVSTIAAFLGPQVEKSVSEARSYKLGDAVPREPFITNYDLGPNANASGLPSEVAVCASFFAGRNLPRQRGRTYIGPFIASVATMVNGAGAVRPAGNLLEAMSGSMKRLQAAAIADGLRWCVLSQADGVLKDITEGWVDNAFDTQRRRGEKPLGRSTWSSFA